MRIKTYTSDSVPQALLKIKKDLGPGAVILKTNRTMKKRFLGLVPSLAYEITAAAEPEDQAEKSKLAAMVRASRNFAEEKDSGENRLGAEASHPEETDREESGQEKKEELFVPKPQIETYELKDDQSEEKPSPALRQPMPARDYQPSGKAREQKRLLNQLEKLSSDVENLIRLVGQRKIDRSISTLFFQSSDVGERLQKLLWDGDDFSAVNGQAGVVCGEFERLLETGLDENVAFLMIRQSLRNCPADENLRDRLRLRLHRAVSEMAHLAPFGSPSSPRACIFVGPTGVGKTTTIAKLAARLSLRDRRKVKLLTFDTYRIAAAEQLKTYGEIIGVPVRVIFSLSELEDAVAMADDEEFLLIDTSGHSHRRVSDYSDLAGFLRRTDQIETHLVLSTTTRQEDLRDAVECFEAFGPEKLIFTKLDESSAYGVILNELVRTEKPLSYLTNGQDVAEDLIVPEKSTVADLLVPVQ